MLGRGRTDTFTPVLTENTDFTHRDLANLDYSLGDSNRTMSKNSSKLPTTYHKIPIECCIADKAPQKFSFSLPPCTSYRGLTRSEGFSTDSIGFTLTINPDVEGFTEDHLTTYKELVRFRDHLVASLAAKAYKGHHKFLGFSKDKQDLESITKSIDERLNPMFKYGPNNETVTIYFSSFEPLLTCANYTSNGLINKKNPVKHINASLVRDATLICIPKVTIQCLACTTQAIGIRMYVSSLFVCRIRQIEVRISLLEEITNAISNSLTEEIKGFKLSDLRESKNESSSEEY